MPIQQSAILYEFPHLSTAPIRAIFARDYRPLGPSLPTCAPDWAFISCTNESPGIPVVAVVGSTLGAQTRSASIAWSGPGYYGADDRGRTGGRNSGRRAKEVGVLRTAKNRLSSDVRPPHFARDQLCAAADESWLVYCFEETGAVTSEVLGKHMSYADLMSELSRYIFTNAS